MRFRELTLLLFCLAQASAAVQGTAVPFVGCKSDGQLGPQPAPDTPDRVVRVEANIAGRLAYYTAGSNPGVLGPRGWNCLEIIGSSGRTLYVTPGPINYENLPSVGIAGPIIQLGKWDGGTSGRSEVARVVARVFPLERKFVQNVIESQLVRASDVPFGAYPADRLVYRGDRFVEYETPAGSTGLGTSSRLKPGNDPIRGVAILKGSTPDLWLLAMRLPAGMSDLTSRIIQQLEQER